MVTPLEMGSADPGTLSDQPTLAVACVRALMERHGLPKYRQSPGSPTPGPVVLAGASAYDRRLALDARGHRAGRLAVRRVARRVVGPDTAPGSVPGSLKVGSTSLGCRLWLGDVALNPRPDSLVAISTAGGWTAILAAKRPRRRPTRSSGWKPCRRRRPQGHRRARRRPGPHQLDLRPSRGERLRGPAFLQDGRPASSSKAQRYDGFVIDWIVGETSTLKLIAALREKMRSARSSC